MRRRWTLALVAALAPGCRPVAPTSIAPPSGPAPTTVHSGCGDGPACAPGLTCVDHFPIAERPSPPQHACEQVCSFTGDEPCPVGHYCAMESAGVGLVCRPLDATAPPPEIQRLVELAEIWSFVRFAHPWLVTRAVDWDAALVQTIPRVRAAQTDEAFREAIGGLLAALGDPATRVHAPVPAPVEAATATATPTAPEPMSEDGGTVFVDLARVDPWNRTVNGAIAERLRTAERIVFDLREWPAMYAEWVNTAFEPLNPVLVEGEVVLPTIRSRVLHGFPSEATVTSGGYYEGFESTAATLVRGTRAGRAARVAFVVGRWQVLPGIVLPLLERGHAVIVSSEALDERVLSPTTARPMTGGHYEVRVGEPEYRGGRPLPEADAIAKDDPIARARALLEGRPRARPRVVTRTPLPPATRSVPEPTPAAELPDVEHRMLSAIHVWSTLDAFHAYPDVRPRWDGALARALAAMDAAQSWDAYVRVLLELDASVDDGHSHLSGPHVEDVLGSAYAPVDTRVIEGCLVVTRSLHGQREDELRVGDVIAEVDGVSVVDRYTELAPLVAASTVAAHRNAIAKLVLAGHDEGPVSLVIDRDGERITIAMRRMARRGMLERDGPVYEHIADGKLGLVDLTRLGAADVPAMFEALRDTEGIIFDMRGYPRGTAWTIAPYLDQHPGPTPAAEFLQPLVARGAIDPGVGDKRTRFLTMLPEVEVARYDGPTVMLIDERAVSQAEYTGMFLRAANGTRFVGTPTAGANGDITSHVLPDGIEIYFTGQAVAPLHGPPLQRVGLVPDVWVAPTIAGIRAGRDEVLEAAIELLE